MAATGGAGTSSGANTNDNLSGNANAVSVNISSLSIYQFDEDISELNNIIQRALMPSLGMLVFKDVRKSLHRITTNILEYINKTYPDQTLGLTNTTIDKAIDIVMNTYKQRKTTLSQKEIEDTKTHIRNAIHTLIGDSGNITEKLTDLINQITEATTTDELVNIALACLALTNAANQYNTEYTLKTKFSGRGGGRHLRRRKNLTRGRRGRRGRRTVTRRLR